MALVKRSELNVLIFGASGGIGAAMCQLLGQDDRVAHITACSRSGKTPALPKVTSCLFDLMDEQTIIRSVEQASQKGPLDLVIVTTGLLHNDDGLKPEKNLRDLNAEDLIQQFQANAIGPALIAKHALAKLNRKDTAVFAALSARVSSISDNRLGGWYGYRASKSALNMFLKTAAIEVARRNKLAVILGLHPGTVDTGLSKPFQANVAPAKLFTPDFSAEKLLGIMMSGVPEMSGRLWAWDGAEVMP